MKRNIYLLFGFLNSTGKKIKELDPLPGRESWRGEFLSMVPFLGTIFQFKQSLTCLDQSPSASSPKTGKLRKHEGSELSKKILKGQCHEIFENLFCLRSTWAPYEQAKMVSQILSLSQRYSQQTCVCLVVDYATLCLRGR